MFAQAGGRTANPWTISVSIAIQSMLIATAILFPLLRIEALPMVKLSEAKLAPPHILTVAVPISVLRAIQASNPRISLRSPQPIQIPTRIPTSAPVVLDAQKLLDAAPSLAPTNGAPPLLLSLANVVAPPAPPAQLPKVKPATQPAVTTDAPYRVGGDVKGPILKSATKPAYPDLARRTRTQGTVRLNGIISRDGTVRSLEVVSGHPLLIQAAIEAVRAWLYDPARLNGQPVDVILVIDVNFTLAQ